MYDAHLLLRQVGVAIFDQVLDLLHEELEIGTGHLDQGPGIFGQGLWGLGLRMLLSEV